ncbi:uncharacterized protein EDB93DRAFT_1251689 [Suillus bovinus]|uniref:uncharacterized protein n=1 Tax=Suillus bovinus TaxID=48563 RepID=UPI001B861122|nr:uncharacterized protein EDB93DRAFT_1251689 [Suillus bovinus]KAG2144453.1 hypothetical protein EDB93DRAFT_1251689 [Suillus bovinus]
MKWKVSLLKANAWAAKVDVDFTLQQYAYGSSKPTKLAIPSSQVTFATVDLASSAFKQLALKARGLYDNTPTLSGLSNTALDVMFDWHRIKYCMVLTNATVNMIEEQKYLAAPATMETLYRKLRQDRMLSDKDASAKTPRITLCMFLYVPEEPEDDDVQEVQQSQCVSTRKSTTASSHRQKRKRSPTASPERLPPPMRYQSSYRSRQSATAPILEYKTFKMKRATCTVSKTADIQMNYSEEQEEIMIAKGWQAHVKAGKPYQGYLGQGLTKFVFCGRYNNKDCAIVQCKSVRATEAENIVDLEGEYQTLHLSQVDDLPRMKWNISTAFIGKLTEKLPDAPGKDEPDSRSLIFSVFMVLPLLPSGALCREVKFSGSKEVGLNPDSLGCAVDAYAHHIAVDSMYEVVISDIQGIITPDCTIILFDPQSHMAQGDSGYWDHGRSAITKFLKSHKCNKHCRALGLDTELPPLSNTNRKGPLHISFED